MKRDSQRKYFQLRNKTVQHGIIASKVLIKPIQEIILRQPHRVNPNLILPVKLKSQEKWIKSNHHIAAPSKLRREKGVKFKKNNRQNVISKNPNIKVPAVKRGKQLYQTQHNSKS